MTEDERKARALGLEHVVGGGVAAAGILPALTARAQQDISKLKATKDWREIMRKARAGDVLLAASKDTGSGWKFFGSKITGMPYTHAEILYKHPRLAGLRGGLPDWTTQGNPLRHSLEDTESAIIMRPKHIPANAKKIYSAVKPVVMEHYSDTTVPLTFIRRLFTPNVPGLEKLPRIGKGNVCSTTPMSVLRQLGQPNIKGVMQGTELPSDYLRDPNFKPVALYGKKFNMPAEARRLFLHRAGFAGALGAGAYQAVKDIKEDRPLAPAFGAAGLGLGMVGGGYAERKFTMRPEETVRKLHGIIKSVTKSPTVQKPLFSIIKALAKLPKNYGVWMTAGGAAGGGAVGYALGRIIHHYANKRRQAASVSRQ